MVDLKRQAGLNDAIELIYFAYRAFTDPTQVGKFELIPLAFYELLFYNEVCKI